MAKDAQGRKFNRIPPYIRVRGGQQETVKAHIRSNRKDSRGKKG